MTKIGKDISYAAKLLKQGELVAIPTETVYGLAGNAFDHNTVTKIYQVKNRPVYNPLIVHIADLSTLYSVTDKKIPAIAIKLMEKFWPGPLTLLLPKNKNIPQIVTSGLPNVAVRIPNHPLTTKLLRQLDFPLVAPSANRFGYISPTSPNHVFQQFAEKIPYILDGGACSAGIESTIVGFDDDTVVIYRLGAVTPGEIFRVAKKIRVNEKDSIVPLSPGMLPHHYAPSTPLYMTNNVSELLLHFNPAEVGIISLNKTFQKVPIQQQIKLSAEEDLKEAARNLYKALYQLDMMKLKVILTEKMPDTGLGITINDRLMRASSKNN